MAEGLLGGLLGGEEEKPEPDAADAQASAEAFAAVIAADQAKHDPGVAEDTRAFLKEQALLLQAQREEVTEQRPLRLTHLHSQSQEGKLRRFGQRIRNGMQVLTALVFVVIGVGLGVMVYDAFTARSVVVNAFDTPPALAARGLSGTVVAGGLLDELTRLQAATRSSAAKRNLSNAWTGDIKVEVPETGLSLGDIDRMLKARFGHDLHIGGDLVQTDSGGLALTVRGDGVLPKVFSGGAGDLDKLTAQAAEYIYGQSQPALFVTDVSNTGRNAEAVAFAKAAYATTSAKDRPYLLNEWATSLANTGATVQATMPLYREALKQKPDYWGAYNNVMNSQWLLGDEEGAWRTGEAMRKAAGGRPGRAPESDYQNPDTLTWNLQAGVRRRLPTRRRTRALEPIPRPKVQSSPTWTCGCTTCPTPSSSCKPPRATPRTRASSPSPISSTAASPPRPATALAPPPRWRPSPPPTPIPSCRVIIPATSAGSRPQRRRPAIPTRRTRR